GTYAYTTTAGLCAVGTPATKPHAAARADSTTYVYDCNGNLTVGAGRIIAWGRENRASVVQHVSGTRAAGRYIGAPPQHRHTTHAVGASQWPPSALWSARSGQLRRPTHV